MFGLYFAARVPSSYAEVMACDKERFNRFFHAMLDAGIYLAPSAYEAGFVSSAHGDAEIAATIDAADHAFAVCVRKWLVRTCSALQALVVAFFFRRDAGGPPLGARRLSNPMKNVQRRRYAIHRLAADAFYRNAMHDFHDLRLILRARVPLVVVETHEERKLVAEIERIAREWTLPFFVWSAADGLVHRTFAWREPRDDVRWGVAEGHKATPAEPPANPHAIEGTQDLRGALGHIDGKGEAGSTCFATRIRSSTIRSCGACCARSRCIMRTSPARSYCCRRSSSCRRN